MMTLQTLKKIGFFEKRAQMAKRAHQLGLQDLRLTTCLKAEKDALYLLVKRPPEGKETDEDALTTFEMDLDELYEEKIPIHVSSEQGIKFGYEMTRKEYEYTRENLLSKLEYALPIFLVQMNTELNHQFEAQKAKSKVREGYNSTLWLYGVDNASELSSIKQYRVDKALTYEERKEGEMSSNLTIGMPKPK